MDTSDKSVQTDKEATPTTTSAGRVRTTSAGDANNKEAASTTRYTCTAGGAGLRDAIMAAGNDEASNYLQRLTMD